MRDRRAQIAQYSIGLLLIAILLLLGDLSELGNLLQANLPFLGAAFLCTTLAAVITSYRWSLIVRELTSQHLYPRGFFFRYVLLGQALSFLAPQNMGAMAVRTASLRIAEEVPTPTALYSVLLDRLLDLLLMVGLSLPAVLFLARVLPYQISSALAILVLGLFLASHLLPPRLRPVEISAALYGFTLHLFSRVSFLAQCLPLTRVQTQTYEVTSSTSFRLTVYTVIRFLVFLTRAFVMALAFHIQISPWVLLLGMPLAQLGLVLAITPGGLGITDLGWYAILAVAGIDRADALLFVVGSRAFNLFSAVGLALLANFAIGSKAQGEKGV